MWSAMVGVYHSVNWKNARWNVKICNTFLCMSGRHATKKLELDNPRRQQTRKTPTRERKRVRYLQISYQYHLSPWRRHDSPCGPEDRGLRMCCPGTSCKKKADYTRLMYLSQPDPPPLEQHSKAHAGNRIAWWTHTFQVLFSTDTVNSTQISRLLSKFMDTAPQKQMKFYFGWTTAILFI